MFVKNGMYRIHRKIIICFVGFIFCQFSSGYAVAAGDMIRLDGMHKFSPGDNPAWASPGFHDSEWQSVRVPGSWQSQRISPVQGMGWYRIHFTFKGRIENPAILLGRIGDIDEVFLNGVKIGGEGFIGKRFVEATKIQRLYKMPPDLLRQGDNIVAVRVMNTYLNGGIFDEGSSIGGYNALLVDKLERDRKAVIMEFCLFTFFAIFSLACLFLSVTGMRDKEYVYFWLFITIYSVLFVLGSITFYKTGLKTPFIQQTISSLSMILPAGLLLLIIHVFQLKFRAYLKAILLFYLFIALTIPFFPDFSSRAIVSNIWKVLFIFSAIYMEILAVGVYLRKFYESGPILLGVTGLVIGLIMESIGGLDLLQITGFFLWDYSAVFFMICVMYALTARYVRIQKGLRQTSIKIFDAHEDERRRLAREIHDGIGQSLLSIKLRLKILEEGAKDNTPVKGESISEVIYDISGAIEELRAMVMDLRPSFLENAELIDAMTWHANKIQDKSGITVHVQAKGTIRVSSKTKDNMYRIFQEALSNAVQHSEASRVDIVLEERGKLIVLEIKDNGKGFNQNLKESGRKGIGLYTIRERVELLGGILRVTSAPQTGTQLFIEVPAE